MRVRLACTAQSRSPIACLAAIKQIPLQADTNRGEILSIEDRVLELVVATDKCDLRQLPTPFGTRLGCERVGLRLQTCNLVARR